MKHPRRLVAAAIAEAEAAGLPPVEAAKVVRRIIYPVTDQIERAAVNDAAGARQLHAWTAQLRSEAGVQLRRALRG